MKKLITIGLTIASITMLAACSQQKETNTTQSTTTEQSSTQNYKDTAEKDASIILKGIFSNSSSGFNSLMGQSLKDWKENLTSDYVSEHETTYSPASDYTISLSSGESFTPSKTLELFDQTRWELLERLGSDFKITNVQLSKDNETATITFTSNAIAAKDIANTTTLLKTQLFADGLAGVDEATKSENETVKNANAILNYFLIYYAFGREKLEYGTISDREFTVELEKNSEDRYIISDDNFKELRTELFVDEYSDTSSN